MEFARAYLDDLLRISNEKGFEEHVFNLELLLTQLQAAGLKINASKSFFGRTRMEYLGYNISREGIRPSQKKVEAILQIKPPTAWNYIRRFIGMVNYYRDMRPKRSHMLAPLSSLTSSKVKWECMDKHQQAFEQMKALVAKETWLIFPDLNEEFEICTDASKLQLGACILQKGKPVMFYSGKLLPPRGSYCLLLKP